MRVGDVVVVTNENSFFFCETGIISAVVKTVNNIYYSVLLRDQPDGGIPFRSDELRVVG